MRQRLFILLIALLAIVTGTKAATIELYDGQKWTDNIESVLKVLVDNRILETEKVGKNIVFLRKGKRLFGVEVDKLGNQTIRVPQTVIPSIDSFGALILGERYKVNFSVVINSTTFPDSKFRAYVKDFDTDTRLTPGRLTVSECEAVKNIEVGSNEITSLKGVEYFTNLEVLRCSNNQLKELDVSKNTELYLLNCSLNQLSTLDVSKNTKLSMLYCSKNQIQGEGMATLINSLHESSGDLYVIDAQNEGNLIIPAQVLAATAKRWNVFMFDGSEWVAYDIWPLSIDGVNFPDAIFRAYVSNNCDTNGDGVLSKAECENADSIDVRQKGIADLGGVEFFMNLTYLHCGWNNLTAVDLSKNVKLAKVYLNSNKLKNLDVSKNTNLVELFCAYNELTELDVSNCTELDYVDCKNNQLTKLDVSNKSKLTVLWCERNQLTEINLSGSNLWLNCDYNKLATLDLSDCLIGSISCNNNLLTEIDLSGQPELQALDCEDNQLTTLDLSMNPKLYSLHCKNNQLTMLDLSKNKNLKSLECQNNLLTELDITGCMALEWVDVSNNKLTTLDLSMRENLRNLSCSENQLTALNLSGCSALYYVNCQNNQLTTLDVSDCAKLETFYCINNQLTSLDVSGCSALRYFNCQINQIRGSGMATLVSSLPGDKSSAYLYVYDNRNSTEGNLITRTQAQAATDKGWVVYKYDESSESWVEYAGELVAGDANGDGEVTAADVETISDYILGRLAPGSWFDEESADVVDDGVVDILDLTQLIKIVLNQAYLRCPDDHHPHAIDLGLPSGTKWACCNVGADKPGSYGDYFNWDVNTVQKAWGNNWQMPSKEQMQEIIDNTTMVWTTLDGLNGLLVTGSNGGSMFLPAAGFCISGTTNPSFVGTDGCYWTSTPDSGSNTWGLSFSKDNRDYWNHSNTAGLPIRPVRK